MGVPPITRGLARCIEESTTAAGAPAKPTFESPASETAQPWLRTEAKSRPDFQQLPPGAQTALIKLEAALADFNRLNNASVSMRYEPTTGRFRLLRSEHVTPAQLERVFIEAKITDWFPRLVVSESGAEKELALWANINGVGLPNSPHFISQPHVAAMGRRVINGRDVLAPPRLTPSMLNPVGVRQGEAVVATRGAADFLMTHSIGPCVTVTLFDPVTQKGLLAHADDRGDRSAHLVEIIKATFPEPSRVQARLIGGTDSSNSVKTYETLEAGLRLAGIQVTERNIGASPFRPSAIALDLTTGEVTDATKTGFSFPLIDATTLTTGTRFALTEVKAVALDAVTTAGIALAVPGLFLSASGHIVSRPGQTAPVTSQELGATLTEAAEAMGRGIFPFAVNGISLAQKAAAFEMLSAAIELALDAANFGGNAEQALQTRAAAAPLLLDLAESLNVSQPEQKALFAQLFSRYERATKSEPHPALRAFMVADLERIKHFLPRDVLPSIERLAQEVTPTAPYDDRDHDGVMDNWDHLFTVNTFKAAKASAAELSARKPSVPAAQLNGEALTASVLRIGALAGQRFVAAGFFDGTAADPLFQVSASTESGLHVKVNSQYSHASEALLGSALAYTLGRKHAEQAGLNESDAQASGLSLAARFLERDEASVAAAAWHGLLRHFALPSDLKRPS
ncbi:MAG: hypothetical protein K1X64_13620 [Myxococcaceae bacterium]|nr:hypothetical protein [Myxococcaceae bacterium]